MTDRGSHEADAERGRVRDMPAPRRAEGAAGPLLQRIFTWPYRVIIAGLYRSGVRPWMLTWLSLAANVAIGWLLLGGRRLLPGLLLIPAGLFDVFDGGVARLRGEDGPAGAFLDSVMDRISDAILFGALFWNLSEQGLRIEAALALGTLVVSLLVSHLRAEAEARGLQLSEGLFQRLERYVALMIGLMIPGTLLTVLIALLALGAITVIQRILSALGRLPEPTRPDRDTAAPSAAAGKE